MRAVRGSTASKSRTSPAPLPRQPVRPSGARAARRVPAGRSAAVRGRPGPHRRRCPRAPHRAPATRTGTPPRSGVAARCARSLSITGSMATPPQSVSIPPGWARDRRDPDGGRLRGSARRRNAPARGRERGAGRAVGQPPPPSSRGGTRGGAAPNGARRGPQPATPARPAAVGGCARDGLKAPPAGGFPVRTGWRNPRWPCPRPAQRIKACRRSGPRARYW